MNYKHTDIFVPGGFPKYTYNPRNSLNLESRLLTAKDNLCKLVTITGQTKSGKTVLARKIFPRTEAVWVDGGAVSSLDDFWDIVIEQLNLFTSAEQEESSGRGSEIGGSGSAGANFIVAKGEAGVTAAISEQRGSISRKSRSTSSQVIAIRGLEECKRSLIIDDFHYIEKTLQASIVRALKALIFDGLPVAIIAIPHRRYDAIKVEREMAGRIEQISIPSWSSDELVFIPMTGFKLLGNEFPHTDASVLAEESLGSPHLMQEFCRRIAGRNMLLSDSSPDFSVISVSDKNLIFGEIAETIGRPIFEKLARGPRQRTDRKSRELKTGQIVDIYELVLYALASMKPDLVSLEYEELRTALREVVSGPLPQMHEVVRVVKHMATIAASDESSTPVIDFEEDEKKLHITDPFFAFYLRWGKLSN